MNLLVSEIMESKILKIEQSCIDVWVEKTDEKSDVKIPRWCSSYCMTIVVLPIFPKVPMQ